VKDPSVGEEEVQHYAYVCTKNTDAYEMFCQHYEIVMGFLIIQEQEERKKYVFFC
jgi:hypothetical protein